jgi:peptidoglycan DL-endopeptidase LytF
MPRRTWRSATLAASSLSLLLVPLVALAEPDAAATHVVQPGETLVQIADSLGVEAATLVKLNGLDDANLLVPGQTLSLPVKAAVAPAASVAAPTVIVAAAQTVTVADGDTLWAIAQRLGTTTDALAQANGLDDPNHLALGAHLVVPAAAATPTPLAMAATRPSPSAVAPALKRSLLVSYTVQPGETLNQIARQFGVRADAVAQISGVDDPNKLSIGVVLKVPMPGKEHVVSAGETLRDIAVQEKVDLGSLIDFNQLDDPELIHVGQVVLVPVPANQPPAATIAPTLVPTAAPLVTAPTDANPTRPPAPTPTASQSAAAKASAALAVVAPPKPAPSDGLVGAALKLLGSPYVWGGSSPSGFDCSGFVWYVSRQVGKPLSRGMLGEYNSGAHPARDELKPGDLVFFQNTYSPGLSHNGIFIGNGQFIHAADEAAGVTISSLATAYWSSHWFGATRLP